MPRFAVTVQALLDPGRQGPHFNIQLEAGSYIDALARAGVELEKLLNESGLAISPVAVAPPADAEATPA